MSPAAIECWSAAFRPDPLTVFSGPATPSKLEAVAMMLAIG
jgi:hypothetical protein